MEEALHYLVLQIMNVPSADWRTALEQLNLDRAMAQYQDARICIVVVRFTHKEFSLKRLGLRNMTILGHELWVLVPANASDIEEELRIPNFQTF